ncbi:MAG: hypothetical protein U0235_16015 [Polyangiaceae bacterium]
MTGHSVGGGIASLMSLRGEAPVRFTASVGGIYRAHTFQVWARGPTTQHLVRFDVSSRDEVTLRLLQPNMRELAHPHVTYSGVRDDFDVRYAREAAALAAKLGAPFEAVEVRGDHMSSLVDAVADFRARVERDLPACRAGEPPRVGR